MNLSVPLSHEIEKYVYRIINIAFLCSFNVMCLIAAKTEHRNERSNVRARVGKRDRERYIYSESKRDIYVDAAF